MSESASDGVVSRGPWRPRGSSTNNNGSSNRPDAVAGPFTETGRSTTHTASPGRGVPTEPHGPQDIVAPVEIGSSARDHGAGGDDVRGILAVPPPPHLQEDAAAATTPEGIHGRFELYGSDLAEVAEAPNTPAGPESPSSQTSPLQQTVSPLEPRSRAGSDATTSKPHPP